MIILYKYFVLVVQYSKNRYEFTQKDVSCSVVGNGKFKKMNLTYSTKYTHPANSLTTSNKEWTDNYMLLIFTVALMQLVVRRKSASFAQECWLAFCTFLLYIMRCRMGTPKRNNNSLQYSIWLKIQSMTTEHSSVANALSLFKSVQLKYKCNQISTTQIGL